MSASDGDPYVEEGFDALKFLTPLLEKRRPIIVGTILTALVVGSVAFLMPRKFKAELSLTPVVSNKSTTALGGLAAIAGATLSQGYQLTPAKMVELLKSRSVLSGVGKSVIPGNQKETVIDRFLGEEYTRNDPEEIAKQLTKSLNIVTNKETGTITVSIEHKDSALSRLIASRVVDSASRLFVITSKA
ncbi:MAG: hypothetical protein ABIQ55_06155, partial [Gemmatimonadaceae bacterium]